MMLIQNSEKNKGSHSFLRCIIWKTQCVRKERKASVSLFFALQFVLVKSTFLMWFNSVPCNTEMFLIVAIHFKNSLFHFIIISATGEFGELPKIPKPVHFYVLGHALVKRLNVESNTFAPNHLEDGRLHEEWKSFQCLLLQNNLNSSSPISNRRAYVSNFGLC